MTWGDKMSKDITVTEIVNVYFRENRNWARAVSMPRAFHAIVLFTEGRVEYFFEKRTVVAEAGDLLLLPANLPYSGKCRTSKVSYFVLDFACLSDTEFQEFGAPCAVKVSDFDRCAARFSQALELWEADSPNMKLQIKSRLYSILGDIGTAEPHTAPDRKTGEVLAYIADNIGNPGLTVKKICGEFYISESQLRRNVYKAAGASPNEYILTLRIKKAKQQLSYTDAPIKNIAGICGFASPYYFSRCFSGCVGMSPTEYRTRTRV